MIAESLLILILISNPTVEEDAQGFATRIEQYASVETEIKIGKQANLVLAKQGLTPGDLLAADTIGKTLTRDQKVVLVHVDRKNISGDNLLEAKLWYEGRQESFVSIAGNEGDPLPGLVDGCTSMIGHLLRKKEQVVGVPQSKVSLAQLAKEKAWQQLLAKVAAVPVDERAPIVHYYQVMAYVNLGQRDFAVETLNTFRKKYKGHILVTSAESIIPPRKRSDEELMDLGGAGTLDPLHEGDDEITRVKKDAEEKNEEKQDADGKDVTTETALEKEVKEDEELVITPE